MWSLLNLLLELLVFPETVAAEPVNAVALLAESDVIDIPIESWWFNHCDTEPAETASAVSESDVDETEDSSALFQIH
ncbi:hypothetical protein AVEN_92119-1 [Araneus ventricosus]|uniref:Secreted protein n=1 Tax=Araneus ventricosus TaxID=182803 RepID=A0A4Y2LCI5_ARAVE|nr:hypothetical protein AVEN_92119-1 [Araneus ventricosus]